MNLSKSNRRRFIKSIGALSALPLLTYCRNPILSEPELKPISAGISKPDINLAGNEEQIALTVKNQYNLLEKLVYNPGKEVVIAFPSDNKTKKISLSIAKSKLAPYPYLRIRNLENDETANVVWGMKGIYPSIKFVDDYGNTIVKNKTELEFALKDYEKLYHTPSDWLELGFKIFGLALLIWLGAEALKFIIAAVAFIAFNLLVLGILIAGIALVVPLIKWIVGLTKWSLYEVRITFDKTKSEIINLLYDVQGFLLNN